MTAESMRAALAIAAAAVRASAASNLPDALMIAGAGGIAYGAWLIHEPAGFIVGGALLLVAGVISAKGGR